MANSRTFKVHDLSYNAIAVDGLSTISFSTAHRAVVQSLADGSLGVDDVDRARMRIGMSVSTVDVTKVLTMLATAPALTTFVLERSGTDAAAASQRGVTVAVDDADIIPDSMTLDIPQEGDAILSVGATLRLLGATKELKDALAEIDTQEPGTITYPTRLRFPQALSFDPTGAPDAIPINNAVSIRLSLTAQMAEDGADADLGITDVDRLAWGPLQVSVTHRDSQLDAGGAYDKSAALVNAVEGVLTATLKKAGGGTSQTLTVNNLLWTGVERNNPIEYSEYTVSGVAGFRPRGGSGSVFDLTSGSNPLFDFA